ncbi:MAG TPA: peptidylprolyl isomerase [Tissierellaceae bacterium]|nr:peptidylprolyl isomerase [Tissierellaceae bacterium]
MKENKVVAVVNGKEISQNDVLKFLNDLGPQVAMQFQSPDGIQRVIDEMINQELLYLDAINNGLDEDQDFIEILEETKVAVLKSYALNKLISQEDASLEELKDFYESHKTHYNKDETLLASHILIDELDKAESIIQELNEGLSFEEAAKKYSSCPSKDVGGNLGEFGRGQMVPEFEEAAFNMEEGSISDPVKTQFGYHIIKLAERKPEGSKTFEQVRDEVYKQVIGLKQQNKYLDKVNELKNKYTVEKVN